MISTATDVLPRAEAKASTVGEFPAFRIIKERVAQLTDFAFLEVFQAVFVVRHQLDHGIDLFLWIGKTIKAITVLSRSTTKPCAAVARQYYNCDRHLKIVCLLLKIRIIEAIRQRSSTPQKQTPARRQPNGGFLIKPRDGNPEEAPEVSSVLSSQQHRRQVKNAVFASEEDVPRPEPYKTTRFSLRHNNQQDQRADRQGLVC